MTHTYAILDVSARAFAEIKELLADAGYEHAFHDDVIDMHGIAVRARGADLTDEEIIDATAFDPRTRESNVELIQLRARALCGLGRGDDVSDEMHRAARSRCAEILNERKATGRRVSDEELAHLREIAATHTGGVEMRQWKALAIMDELKERRAADVNLKRLSDVVRGYYSRNGKAPTSTTMDLCDAIDNLLAQGEKP